MPSARTSPDLQSAPALEDCAVLLLAPIGRDAVISAEHLRRADVTTVICQSADELIDRIRSGLGPVVVSAEALAPDAAAQLADVLDREPAWSYLPLIIVAGGRSLAPHLHPLAARQNTTVLHRPLKLTTFITSVRAAVENRLRQYQIRDLLQRLEDRAAQLHRLALELIGAEERERHRLARILHDELQQLLAAAQMRVRTLPRQGPPERLDEAAADLERLLSRAIEQSRNLTYELSPPMLDQQGLPRCLNWLSQRMDQLHRLHVKVDANPDADPPDSRIRMFLFRSAQELLFNVVKHAGVSEAQVHLNCEHGQLQLIVRDEGRGLPPEVLEKQTAGMGLTGIRERLQIFGGKLAIDSRPGAGSTFTLSVPLERSPGQNDAA